jgi:hypothetical protein
MSTSIGNFAYIYTNQNPISKKLGNFGLQKCICKLNFTAIFLKTGFLEPNSEYFTHIAWEIKVVILHIFD